jgi:conflict system pore-forming effector with SLATT domain
MARDNDIRAVALPNLPWDSASASDSLYALVTHASQRAQETTDWYLRAKRGKRIGARLLRLGAIILTTAAGILPILQQIYVGPDGKPPFAPAWASVLLALAVFLLAIDRFYGFSSAWLRYITAELQIKQARETFEIDWEGASASFAGQPPNSEQIRSVIASIRSFVDQINTVVVAETAKWANDFLEALHQIDETTKASAQAPQTGSLSVTIDNGDQVDPPGWSLALDQAPALPYSGKTAAIAGLTSGDHVVRVTAKANNRILRAEALASIRPGTISAVQLSLN